MLTILHSRASQNNREAMLKKMGESAAEHCVFLVPEQYSHECERAMCKVLGNRASRRCEVLSFSRLAKRLNDAYGGGAVGMLDAGGRMLKMYAALKQAQDLLTFYRAPSKKPAFLNSLLTTIDECMSYGVSPEALMTAGEVHPGQQGQKWRDIGIVYNAYLAGLGNSTLDVYGVLEHLADQLESHNWAGGMDVFVYGFEEFTPQQLRVISALAKQANQMTMSLVYDPEDRSGIFETAGRTVKRLKREVPVCLEPLDAPGKYRSSGLAHMEQHLFGPLPEPVCGDNSIVRVACADMRKEAEWVAAQILRLVREEGYRYREIAVCVRKIGSYGDLLESTFGRFGIPVFKSTMTDVLRKPALALITSVLDAVANEYPYEAMFRYLKTGLAGISREACDRLENYVLTWNIRGSKWKQEWNMSPEGYAAEPGEWEKKELEYLNKLRLAVIEPLERLKCAPDKTGQGRMDALRTFLTEVRFERSLEAYVNTLEEKGLAIEAAQCRQLWDCVVNALEQFASVFETAVLEDGECSSLISLVLSQYDVGTIPVFLDCVSVSEAHRMVHKDVKVLFFLGADSLSIPCYEPDAGLFTDQDREALVPYEVELAPNQESKLNHEFTVAYEVCTIPSEKLFLSYAVNVGSGEERLPCFLWERLEKLFHGSLPVTAGESRLATPQTALELAGHSRALMQMLKRAGVDGVAQLEQAAQWRRGSLSRASVEQLFGHTVPMSATRLDVFNSCHFGHFMRFGMEAKPRKEAKFRPTEYGTFVHEVLEKVLGQAADYGGVGVLAEREGLRHSLAEAAADQFQAQVLSRLSDVPSRFLYLFGRMKQAAVAVVDSVVEELAVSDFEPAWFELGFGSGKTLPPVEVKNGTTVSLSGFVDRVDQWMHDGKRYLRIVDYKTGKKSFSYSDVEDGRGLQMLLYLFALARSGQAVFGPEEIVPAGVLYVPARNPVVDGDRSLSPEEVKQMQSSQLRRQGVVLEDPDVIHAMEHTEGSYRFLPITDGRNKADYLVNEHQMELLDEYVTSVLNKTAGQMAEGNIDADPFWHDGRHNACAWCDYKAACHFEECLGDKRRRRKNLSCTAFWQHMEKKEVAEDGN